MLGTSAFPPSITTGNTTRRGLDIRLVASLWFEFKLNSCSFMVSSERIKIQSRFQNHLPFRRTVYVPVVPHALRQRSGCGVRPAPGRGCPLPPPQILSHFPFFSFFTLHSHPPPPVLSSCRSDFPLSSSHPFVLDRTDADGPPLFLFL